jgi:hypothetical protein
MHESGDDRKDDQVLELGKGLLSWHAELGRSELRTGERR